MHNSQGVIPLKDKLCFENANIFDSDSDFADLAHAITVPHGAQIVSTQ